MNDLIEKVFAEMDEYILRPLQPDEFTPYMLEEADPEGASAKVWTTRLEKMVKQGRAVKMFRRSDSNKKISAYKLVNP